MTDQSTLQEPFLDKSQNHLKQSQIVISEHQNALEGPLSEITGLAVDIERCTSENKLFIDYFAKDRLVPSKVHLSSRYISILFEPLGKETQVHILHRHTHTMIKAFTFLQRVNDIFVFDPLDGVQRHVIADSSAFVVLFRCTSGGDDTDKIDFLRINPNNTISQITYEIPNASGTWAQIAACSSDFSYFAIGHYVTKETSTNDMFVEFLKIDSYYFTMKPLSETPRVELNNPDWTYPKCIFIKDTDRALVLIPSVCLQLVNIKTGALLSKVPVTQYRGLELVYYQDTVQYCLNSISTGEEWGINLTPILVKLVPQKTVADFAPQLIKGLCSSSNLMKHALRRVCAFYNSSDVAGMLVNSRSFSLPTMGFKSSRVALLPAAKAFYGINKMEPCGVFIHDLSNLIVQQQMTVLSSILPVCAASNDSLIIDDQSYQFSTRPTESDQIQCFSKFVQQKQEEYGIDLTGVKDVQQFKNYIIYSKKCVLIVYDTKSNKEIVKTFGLRLTFSQDGTAFFVYKGGFSYSFWKRGESGFFVEQIKTLKSAALRVDFVPESNSVLVVFDEESRGIQLYDTETDSVKTVYANPCFQSQSYFVVDDSLLAYPTERRVHGKIEKVMMIYNFKGQYPEIEIANQEILLVQLSKSGKYIYIAVPDQVKIYSLENLKYTIGTDPQQITSFPVANVKKIIETDTCTFLVQQNKKVIKILAVLTIEPEQKLNQFSSGTLLMRQLFLDLENISLPLEDKIETIRTYVTFFEQGMADVFLGPTGYTMIHYIIDRLPSDCLKILLETSSLGDMYQRKIIDGISPLRYAFDKVKVSHYAVLCEFFVQNQSKLQITSDDFLCLMESIVPASKVLIRSLFSTPVYYKAALPLAVKTEQDLISVPTEYQQLGEQMCQKISETIIDKKVETDKIYAYQTSKFQYNFARGSQASLDFLAAFADQDDPEIFKSALSLIVKEKFAQCYPVLKLQCYGFMCLLIMLILKIVFWDQNIVAIFILLALNTVYFLYEMNQLFRSGPSEYFSSLWNYTDILGFSCMYIVTYLSYVSVETSESLKLMISFTIFCLLFRGMSMLRIFGSLRSLIHMVLEIIQDMASFAILLVFWIIGINLIFFLFLEVPQLGLEQTHFELMGSLFLSSLGGTYKLSFGDFGDSESYGAVQWVLFVITTVFIPLIMFNLIIAIMGDTYSRVKEESVMVDLKEQANLVSEIESLMTWKREIGEEKYITLAYEDSLFDDGSAQKEAEKKSGALFENVSKMCAQLSQLQENVKKINSKDD